MKLRLALVLAMSLPVMPATPALAQQAAAEDDPLDAEVSKALDAIHRSDPATASAILDAVLPKYEARYKDEKRMIFCAANTNEALIYMTEAAAASDKAKLKRDAVALGPGWCTGLWAKGFALIDLGKLDEAVPYLERAVELAPSHAHFLSELAYAYQARREWARSLELYRRAVGAAALANEDVRKSELGRAWRGVGYDQIELGNWDAAEAAYRKALEINPDDAKSKGELEYIAQKRPKPQGS